MSDVFQNSSTPPTQRSGCLIAWLIIMTQLIGLLSLILWLFELGFASLDVLVFTPLSNGGNPMEHPVLGSSFQIEGLFYPVVLIGLSIAAWIFFTFKKYKVALTITLLQLLCTVSSVLLY